MPRIKYKNFEGKPLKGVTPIIDVLNKPALLWWAMDQGRAIERGEIDSLYDKRDAAADAGTHAHKMVECHLKGLPEPGADGLDREMLDKAEGCYIAFLEWERAHSLEVVESELSLISEKHQYGGT